jgi:hypothetical protein
VSTFPKPIYQLKCSVCGAAADAACDCGASYSPAGARAAKAVARNPEKSDRAIAAETGASDKTVAKARRKATAEKSAVAEPAAKRIGKDGKARRVPKKMKAPANEKPITPSKVRADIKMLLRARLPLLKDIDLIKAKEDVADVFEREMMRRAMYPSDATVDAVDALDTTTTLETEPPDIPADIVEPMPIDPSKLLN